MDHLQRLTLRFSFGGAALANDVHTIVFVHPATAQQMRTDWLTQGIATYEVFTEGRDNTPTPRILMVRWTDVLVVC